MTQETLKNILVQVDLGYLAERPNVMIAEINWEEELSLGEKTANCNCSGLFSKPKFAILDECTSAVSSEMEIRLYQICQDLGITYITISHRPALQAFHDRMLAIGDGKRGWKITTIDRDRHLREFKKISKQKQFPMMPNCQSRNFLTRDQRTTAAKWKAETKRLLIVPTRVLGQNSDTF